MMDYFVHESAQHCKPAGPANAANACRMIWDALKKLKAYAINSAESAELIVCVCLCESVAK